MYRYECIYRIHVCVNVCVCVCARADVVWPSVQMCVCIDARVHGQLSTFRYVYFGAASRRACERAVAADARAGAPALGCICLSVQSPLRMHRCACHAHAGACLGHAR